jgi:hypothetical protein
MKSSRMIFGVILAGCLMFAAPGCVVVDPADEAEMEAEWAEELLDDAVEDLEQGEGAGDQELETLDEDPDPQTWPDPFDPPPPGNGGGTGG